MTRILKDTPEVTFVLSLNIIIITIYVDRPTI